MKRNHLALTILIAGATLLRVCGANFVVKNETAFAKLFPEAGTLEKLGTDMGFLEGPAWVPKDGGYLIFSDIPNDELKKWTREAGITTFRKPSHNANGNTVSPEHELVTAEHSGRRICLTQTDGSVVTLVDKYEGKKFNSPNDVIVQSDGAVWFTDPDYGLGKSPKEQEGNYVYRYDRKSNEARAVIKDCDKPNGLAFSPDETKLYVADSGKPHHIRVFAVGKDHSVSDGKVFCVIDKGGPDGIRCDAQGHIWSSAGDGIHIFGPDGVLIGKLLVPETPANLCFGGADGKTLFITARKSLYAIPTLMSGPKYHAR
jgi:gluconolactonase